MCQMLSPERAVIWSVLHEGTLDVPLAAGVRADHFTHPPYRCWFDLADRLRRDGAAVGVVDAETFVHLLEDAGETPSHADRRALRRMFRVAPPPRIRANLGLLAQALADRHAGRRVHMEKLIN